MAKLKITIDPLAIVALFLFVYFGWINEILFYIVALAIHEYAHYAMARKLGYELNNIKFSPFGAVLNGNNNYFKVKDEILVALAGPLTNLILAIMVVASWWIMPTSYNITYNFLLANVSLFICNMLPLFPLDAGRIILVLIKNNRNFKKLYRIYRINSILIGLVFIVLFAMSAFTKINLSLLFIAILLFMSTCNLNRDIYYKYTYISKLENSYDNILEIKEYVVPQDTNYQLLLKLIDKNSYTIFAFIDKDGKIINKLTEKELLNLLKTSK